MSKTSFLIAAGFAACVCLSAADAQAREHSRSVQRSAHGGSVAVNRSNARFDSQRERSWSADGHGNAAASRSASIAGAHGGSAGRQGSAWRNADGSAGRQGSAYVNGRNGGSASTSGAIARSADGQLSGSRSTSAVGPNGKHYTGSTSVSDGTLTHTHACTDAAGAAVACRGR